MIKIKICGITNAEDAMLAANLGADLVGFNFVKESPRKVSVKLASEVISSLPGFVASVGVFADEDLDALVKAAKKCALKYIQLHGSESPEYCATVFSKTSLPIIKAFRVKDDSVVEEMKNYLNCADFFLLDAFSEDAAGGTGKVFNWDIALKARDLNKPFFLAGGLAPENVADAVEKVRPFGVDAASGVERLQRRKDYDKMKNFITAARRA